MFSDISLISAKNANAINLKNTPTSRLYNKVGYSRWAAIYGQCRLLR